ncbi:hypothetical protein CEUSTIGMA_g1579.t1 [Chlamydomonas eustigma]|uniref:Vacuolar cation/proton exchanger n=1 Tax=Chlamydomonas eustigma TaxID=1157962 RepID=A0A250WU86_9CHLO|nr:hypothetical protein CEUSTIGMA_g1579.t1 [Chlamydomonas eustigma]|eukprot:GAX74130.1 hypothetical protein CEUSTIGMA_g1579.t1 [Chlamydomonas eustigma]
MPSKSMTKALIAVRAAVRMKILLRRLGETQEDATPLLRDAPKMLSERIAVAKISLRPASSAAQSIDVSTPRSQVSVNWMYNDLFAIHALLTASALNLLLLVIPLALASGILGWGALPTFWLNLLSLIPLALVLGDVTEDLALRFGNIIGGLLNATFGNIVEVILSVAALEKGLYVVVASSLVGSVLSNLLLVLGCCFFFGGLYYKVQTFNATSNRACSSLLFLAAIGVAIPTAAKNILMGDSSVDSEQTILWISRGTAIILFACYLCYLYFQLQTHADLFDGEHDDEEVEEEPMLTTTAATLLLASISVLVAIHSEYLTGSIEEVSADTGMSQAFIGMIVLPIAGNACEHMAAIVVATKNKMELSLGIAIGSSLQISLCVLPFVVLVGWATGHAMTLALDLFIVVALVLSVIHANFITADATSHWLMGVALIAVYLLIALAYFFQ